MNLRETNSRPETNPYFSRPRPQHEDYQQPPIPIVPHQEHNGQPPPLRGAPIIQQEDPPYSDHFPLRPRHADPQQPPISQAPPRGHRSQPRRGTRTQHENQPYQPPEEHGGQPPRGGAPTQHEDQPYQPGRQRVNFLEPFPKPHGSPVLPPLDHPPERRQPHHEHPHHEHRRKQRHHPLLPPPQKGKIWTWLGIVFCIIFWLVIIIGGLIVLIVYLVFRPQSPHFDVSSVTLNAAYLDLGYLLNADLTMLANFTNPNKKVHVDFSSVIIYLYYGSTLIATQYVEPFSAAKVQSKFATIHMVTSQVQLPLSESQRLMKQMEINGVLLQVLGVFRARSKLGSILRYSYNLYGHCNIMVTRPPDGILLKKKCRTKR